MKIIGLFFFFIFIIVFPNYSADYYFANVNIDSGLPSNVTSAIVQDNRGFIWIGTEKGLCRYDAYSMVYFNKESQHLRLPSNRISSLLLDGDMLWVGTWEKLSACLYRASMCHFDIGTTLFLFLLDSHRIDFSTC